MTSPGLPPPDSQAAIDIALDYAAAGLTTEAIEVLDAASRTPGRSAPSRPAPVVDPMVVYALGWLADRAGDHVAALEHYRRAATMPPDGCFPARVAEIEILEAAQAAVPDDPRAPYYLGNLFYDRRRYADAIACWRRATPTGSCVPYRAPEPRDRTGQRPRTAGCRAPFVPASLRGRSW